MRRLLLIAVAAVATVPALGACSSGRPGQSFAQDACTAYANTMRHQTATTVAQADTIRATARDDAHRAAAADVTWATLRDDIDEFFVRQGAFTQQSAVEEANAYFAADRRVQADCAAAGKDIGPLQP